MRPRNGLEVIGAMRFAHPSWEVRSLAFTVTTTTGEGSTRRTQSRAQVRLPGKFRQASLPSTTRTGFVRDRQRLAVFEKGRRVASVSRVDLVTLLAYDVFAQAIDTTIMWLDSARVRYGVTRRDELDGRDVWVVGAEKGDITSPQFWVDAELWRVVRVIQRDPRGRNEVIDVRFPEFVDIRTLPLPSRSVTYRGGEPAFTQHFSKIAVNPTIPTSAFDLARWREVR
jgi:outer membrane lipoprotein-sorting protein